MREDLQTIEEMTRFWSKVQLPFHPHLECWEWIASTEKAGYGVFALRKKVVKAHRVSYIANIGAIPDGLVTDHLCRNRRCVNPNHLELVTQRENVVRGERSQLNSSKTSQFPGVTWNTQKQKWVAMIFIKRKLTYLGQFEHELDAAKAYTQAKAAL